MTVTQAIAHATALTGSVVGTAEATRWLSGYDGKLAREFFKADDWDEYNATTDANKQLLIPHPWDGLYVHYLEAMTYYTTGEYQRYENARGLETSLLVDFKAWVMRRYGRPGPAALAAITGEED